MGFDLGAMLKDVSKLDTSRKQITYIRRELLDSDAGNFYQLQGISALADNIATIGLQQPIVVRESSEAGRYTIVSGHRRMAAVTELAKEDPDAWTEIPCLIERDNASPALRQLQLIYGNANTRVLTAAEISQQAEEVEKLLYQLQEEGYAFPGRMRDHVAQVVGVSRSKLARLKVIREKLEPDWAGLFQAGKLSESQAYALAQLDPGYQNEIFASRPKRERTDITAGHIDTLGRRFAAVNSRVCPQNGQPCENADNIRRKIGGAESWRADFECEKCCADCGQLDTCPLSCRLCAEKKAKMIAAEKRREEKRAAKDAAEAETEIAPIRELWLRFAAALEKAGKTLDDVAEATGNGWWYTPRDKSEANLRGEQLVRYSNAPIPRCSMDELVCLRKTAELLGVSADYLIGRDVPNLDTSWKTGTPEAPGTYAVIVGAPEGALGWKNDITQAGWDGSGWIVYGALLEPEILAVKFWTEVPEE